MWNDKRVSLVIPAYNEERGIGLTLKKFSQGLFDEIIVVDNNSTDSTVKVANHYHARVIKEPRQGYGAAIKRGLLEATSDLIVITEADDSFVFKDVYRFLPLISQFDLVVGSRTYSNWSKKNTEFTTTLRFGNYFLGKLVTLLWRNFSLTDVGCTYRIITRAFCNRYIQSVESTGPEFSLEMILKAANLSGKITEIPVHYKKRVGTPKNTPSLQKATINGIRMLWILVKMLLFRFKH